MRGGKAAPVKFAKAGTVVPRLNMGHRAWGMGQRAWGMGQRAEGVGHRAWDGDERESIF